MDVEMFKYREATLFGQKISRIVRDGWWITIVSGLACSSAALLFCLAQTPIYRASATLYVTSASDDNTQAAYQGNLASQQRVISYTHLVQSDGVLSRAIAQSHANVSVADLRSSVGASATPNTSLLVLTVDSEDSTKASVIASALASAMSQYVSELERPQQGSAPLAKLTVVSPASVSSTPVSPRTTSNVLIAFVFGMLGGVVISILRSRFDSRVRSAADLREIADIPILGVIPEAPSSGSVGVRASSDADLVVSAAANEAFRKLRANLSFVSVDRDVSRVMVTSPNPGDGKSFVAARLAMTLAEAGAVTVLVDGDLRRPTLSGQFSLQHEIGLTEALKGAVGVEEVAQECGVEGMRMICSGVIPPNPSELLGSDKSGQFLGSVAAVFDWTVVDCAPVLPVSDPCVLSQWTDGVIIIVRAGVSRWQDVSECVESLRGVNARILGFVLNGVSRSGTYYSSSYYSLSNTASP